jgi:hypothetical protein
LLKAQHTLSCPAAVLLAVLTADLLGWDFFKIWDGWWDDAVCYCTNSAAAE